jgi:uncharacterized protein (DUF1501 family)
MNTRRDFLKHSTLTGAARLGALAGLARFGALNAFAQAPDYKALVCIFMFGGNDGNNLIVPQSHSEFAAYKTVRGSLALPDTNSKILPIAAADGTPFGLSDGLVSIHPLWAQQRLAIVANVGMLVQPTSRSQYLANTVSLPTNLFSHSDQQLQMQAGIPSSSASTGWAGRVADAVASLNAGKTFPASISMSGPALFSKGNVVQSASLIPGFDMQMSGFNPWPASAAKARQQALQEILTMDSGLSVIQAANKVRQDALSLSAMLTGLKSSTPMSTKFPATAIGRQLLQVAQILQLRDQIGLKRQVFFCSIGGFDTHSGQSWQQWDLMRQIAEGAQAFYNATTELGIADKVTTFTESEFGRTLQPSGSGTDHGWGSHHMVLGGAVKGGDIYGRFPVMALGGPDDSSVRGAWIPSTSTDQYGATLAKWFGVDAGGLATVFPNLAQFPVPNLGFMG